MVKSNNELLEQIKLDRIESLKLVRESISSNQDLVLNNIADAMSFISKDEEATKHLKTIIKAKDMIASLMTKATLATTDEELIAVRKSLNYYLNKVKNEIQKRNMPEEEYNQYYQNMSYLREDISECLRVMKRQVKLDRLTDAINSGNLTSEELKKLKKDLNNEKRFNKRLLEKYGASNGVKRKAKKPPVTIKNPVLPKEETTQLIFQENNLLSKLEEVPVINEEELTLPEEVPVINEEKFTLPEEIAVISEEEPTLDSIKEACLLALQIIEQDDQNFYDFSAELDRVDAEFIQECTPEMQDTILSWQESIIKDYNRYNLERPREYGEKLFKNISILISNFGIYYRNNARTKRMIADYNMYCHSESLNRLIDYTLYNNSIRGALDQIFRNTVLGRHESQKVREHRLYMEEIYQAINFKEIDIDSKLVKTL